MVCAEWRKVNLLREPYGTPFLLVQWTWTIISFIYLQDPKPHRSFAFNEILDALEYDLQTNKQSSVPSASPSQRADGDEVTGSHAFKIVTTNRTLLLCAPSEDDEIKWLGAIRALIARRTESGQVPGKVSKTRSPPERRLSVSGMHHGEQD